MAVIPKKRRYNAENTSYERIDADGACTIEQFVALKDPFRAAPIFKIPTPWPFQKGRASPDFHSLVDELEDDVRAILETYNITLNSISVRSLKTKGFENSKDTLILFSHDDDPTLWKAAAQEVYDVINKVAEPKGLPFRVEIQNAYKMYRDMSTAIVQDTEIHRALLAVQPLVEEAVEKACPDACRSISYSMRGPKHDGNRKATVMIMIKPGTRHIWNLIEEKIDEALQSADIPLSITIHQELYSGYIYDLTSPIPQPERMFFANLPSNPQNGSSIGPRGCLEAGTLGVFVYFQPEDATEKKHCILTCYHVIGPGDAIHQKDNDKVGIAMQGQKIPANPIQIDYPAPVDAVETKKMLADMEGSLDEKMLATLSTIKCHSDAGGIGSVLCASGKHQGPNFRRMDWAIIELKSPLLFHQNQVPVIDIDDHRQKYLSAKQRYRATEGEIVSKVGTDLKKDSWVIKTGRSHIMGDHFTAGTVNAMDAKVYWDGSRTTRETVINSQISGEPFAEPGDSGSMITSWKKEWIGMCMSADQSQDQDFIMLAQEIIDDVKAKTGGTISLA